MSLICIVSLTVEREGTRRTFRGSPESKDWDRLAEGKRRDGWRVVSHRRDFHEGGQSGEVKDSVRL